MKKAGYYLFLIISLTMLAACSGSFKGSGGNADNASGQIEGTNESIAFSDVSLLWEKEDPRWFINGFPYNHGEVAAILDSFENMTASENLYVCIPEKCSLYRYTSMAPEDRSNKPYYDEFKQAFAFFFPDRTLNEDYLFYWDGTDLLVRDHLDDILADRNGVVTFEYNEGPKGNNATWHSQIALELGNPIGYGRASINKGKAVELTGLIKDPLTNEERYPSLSYYGLGDFFPVVDYYAPQSEKSFRLADGEISIRDAVRIFEDYAASFPFPAEANMEQKVTEVCVFEIKEDQYAYEFLTVGEYQGVLLDTLGRGCHTNGLDRYYLFTGGWAIMLESSDIDVIVSLTRKDNLTDITELQNSIPFGEAAKLLSKQLTPHVKFTVERVEFVYSIQYVPTEEGYVNIETYAMNQEPEWKFTLYNPNSSLTYVFYVNAENGSTRYFTTEERLGLCQ